MQNEVKRPRCPQDIRLAKPLIDLADMYDIESSELETSGRYSLARDAPRIGCPILRHQSRYPFYPFYDFY
jgi:hypothetical protein